MKMKPVHPGEILAEEFLGPMGISQYRLAKEGLWDKIKEAITPALGRVACL